VRPERYAEIERHRREIADEEWDRAWEPLEREERVKRCRELEAKWAAEDRHDKPVCLVEPLSDEQEQAAQDADAARLRIEDRISYLHAHPVARSLNCGRGRVLHLQRDRGIHQHQLAQEARGRMISYKTAAKECGTGSGDSEHALIRLRCGRSDCPFCWRRRLTKTYRRAILCLLYAPGEGVRPRTGQLHAGEIEPLAWDTWDRVHRRKYGGKPGRLRVRRTAGTLLVIAEHPFAGSRPVKPAEALDLASAAIDQLHTGRHSFRLLGAWNDSRRPHWRLLERIREAPDKPALDFDAVFQELRDDGRKARRFHEPDIEGLIWRGDGSVKTLCPTKAKEEKGSPRRKTDMTAPDERGERMYDPGVSPWG
jgi:hypothetical protein